MILTNPSVCAVFPSPGDVGHDMQQTHTVFVCQPKPVVQFFQAQEVLNMLLQQTHVLSSCMIRLHFNQP